MSEFKVPYTKILAIENHPNADRLEICTVYDFKVVVQKDKYKVNDDIIYVPIDSVLNEELEKILFPVGSKITLHHKRIKQIRIRNFPSQGMIINVNDVAHILGMDRVRKLGSYEENEDLSTELNIIKYEPPRASYQQGLKTPRNRPLENKFFHKYGGIDNSKWYPNLFQENELVSVTEKIHGSSIKAGYVPYDANTSFKKLLKLLKFNPSHEWVYGSNNVQLQQRTQWWKFWNKYKGFYCEDIYGKVLKKYKIKDKLKPGEVIYGELYGDGIQKNYTYGCKQGEHKLVLFDVKIQTENSSNYLSIDQFQSWCKEHNLPSVPELYKGPFNKNLVKSLTIGNSILHPFQKVREGVVVKSIIEETCIIGRKVLKYISEEYLDKEQTDFH